MKMERATLILGNGLGMALDPDYFSLKKAMEVTWNDENCITQEQRELISNCLIPQRVDGIPTNENDLYILHKTINACEFLNSIARNKPGWLTEQGKNFPSASSQYLTKVAWYFHHYKNELPGTFTDSLCEFIKESNSHIATLNYDKLLYKKMIEAHILERYNNNLIDGFYDSGFKEDNLERKGKKDFGYYLHLHGTPLFIDKDKVVIKQKIPTAKEISTRHIVLAHVRYKPMLIDSSVVLSAYWRYLSLALQESTKIYVFGYFGTDTHLNNVIASQAFGKKIIVIEWSGTGKFSERSELWKKEFKSKDVALIQMENILEYTDWK